MSLNQTDVDLLKQELCEKNQQISDLNRFMTRISRERDVTNKLNSDLRNQLELLSAKLHLHQNIAKTYTKSVAIQTDLSLLNDNEWQNNSLLTNTSIANLVKQTAERVIQTNDYCYDHVSNTYYSRSSGWYYYPERELFYDPHSTNYYKYNCDTKKYDLYSTLQQSSGQQQQNKKILKAKKLKKEKLCEENNEEGIDKEVSDTECIDISSSEEGEIDSICSDHSTQEEIINDYGPPLVRMIVKESSSLEIGSLLIVTCMGAKIGNHSKCDVWITDECVSKFHAEIKYSDCIKNYVIKDLSSTNGSFRNGVKILNDEEIELNHNDEICLGDCRLLVHIHNGRDVTCDNCEPGLVQAKLHQQSSDIFCADNELTRRQNLKLLKKKFGLNKIDYCDLNFIAPIDYKDRSDERRKIVGSDNPYEKTFIPTADDLKLSKSNKGFQLMEKMGWNSGEGLGKDQTGDTQPISYEMRQTRAGLGFQATNT